MFTWLNKQGVESDSGFVVQHTGRFTCEYREGGYSLEVDVESGIDGDRILCDQVDVIVANNGRA